MIRGIILAAGRGTRINKITKKSHKSLIKINGKSLIEQIIQNFIKNKINKISIVTGYNNVLFKKFNLKKFNNKYWKETNMVFSLMQADSWLNKYPCIISYSDIFYEKQALKFLKESKSSFAILNNINWKKNWQSRYKKPLLDAESFKIDKKNYLIEIGKKEKKIKDIEGQYMGLIKITPRIWKIMKKKIPSIKKKNRISCTELLNDLINKGIQIKSIPYKHKWYEVDNIKDLKFMQKTIND